MKHIFKLTSLLLCLLLLLSSVISCAPSEAENADDSTAEVASADTTEVSDTAVSELTIEEIIDSFPGVEYTLDDSPVLAREFLTALYLMNGEEEYEKLVPIENIRGTWYEDAVLWAVNNSVAGFEFTYYSSLFAASGRFFGFWGEGGTYEEYLRCLDDPDASPGLIWFQIGDEYDQTEVTRSDALVALYRFTTKVLEKDVSPKGDISAYADCDKFPTEDDFIGNSTLYLNAHKMYKWVMYDFSDDYSNDILSPIWLWALDAGIVEPYADNTLRPDATLTRAEFAVMLERFMDYVK